MIEIQVPSLDIQGTVFEVRFVLGIFFGGPNTEPQQVAMDV